MDFEQWFASRNEAAKCWCERCRPSALSDMRMIVCPSCGDKRCVHAADHEAPCALTDIYQHNAWVARKLTPPATPQAKQG